MNVFYDTNTTYQGDLTWRVEPANSVASPPSWGPDHSLIAISPGENIVMECWVKTSGSAGVTAQERESVITMEPLTVN